MSYWLLLMSLTFSAYAGNPEQIQKQIEQVLKERHPTDTPEWWKGLGEETPSVIRGMYEQTDRKSHRLKLVQAMAWFDDPESVEWLKEIAGETSDTLLRNSAIRSVASSQGVRELEFLEKFLKSDEAHTRLAAARAIQKIPDESAKKTLEAYQKTEGAPWIIAQLQRPEKEVSDSALKIQIPSFTKEFEGAWKGVWVGPNPNSSDLDSKSVQMKLEKVSENEMRGEMTWKEEKKHYTLQFAEVRGNPSRIRGKVLGKTGVSAAPQQSSFVGRIHVENGFRFLVLEMNEWGVRVLLRKSP